jgi:lysyl-tRNA synthetase class 2
MRFKVSPSIFHDFKGTTIGVVVAHDIKNSVDNHEVKALLNKVQEEVRSKLNPQTIEEHPHISSWIDAYKKFGAKPKKHIPSVLNLVQRVFKGPLPSINTLVDLYNVISLKYLLPAGGEDLATIKGDIQLTIAGDNEFPVKLLGEKEERAPEKGEVFYKDENGAICRRWNWKEADRTKLTPNTHDAFLVLEALDQVKPEIVEKAMNELATLIEKYCGGKVSVALITQAHPEIELQKNGVWLQLNQPKEIQDVSTDVYSLHGIDALQAITHEKIAGEHKVRLEKIEKMKAAGIEPWPAGKEINATCHDVIDEFGDEHESREYAIEGRIMTMRGHGKTIFINIQDRTGVLQVYLKNDIVGEEKFKQFNDFFDIGDFMWVQGHSFKTKTGEITLKVADFAMQSKCLYPLPDKFHGISDVEVRYRQRYLDLISSPETRDVFKKRIQMVRTIRNYFDSYGFLEVETPMLHPIPGGAAARPFITHHNTLDTDFYLRIAPELYLKRLVVGGFERVYEINRNFRNEGISTKHNPEFTMVEFYTAYKDYIWAMDFTENLFKRIAIECCNTLSLQFGEHIIDFEKPFARLSMEESVASYGGFSSDEVRNNIDGIIKKHNIEIANKNASWGEKLCALFEEFVEDKLIQPTFITHFPVEVSPLAKRDPNNSQIAARFEMFIAGMELSNGFNELNDPFDQAQRFLEQAQARTAGDIEAHYYDADYVHALEYALPPTVGVGFGIDRLAMLITNTTSIKDVILFPTLKKK